MSNASPTLIEITKLLDQKFVNFGREVDVKLSEQTSDFDKKLETRTAFLIEFIDGQFVKFAESLSPTIDGVQEIKGLLVNFDDLIMKLELLIKASGEVHKESRNLRRAVERLENGFTTLRQKQNLTPRMLAAFEGRLKKLEALR